MAKPSVVAQKTKMGKVKLPAALRLLSLLMMRNVLNPIKREAYRLSFLQNMKDLNTHPEHHLTFALKSISDLSDKNESPTFEHGLMLGATIVLCSRAHETLALIERIAGEIQNQQATNLEITKRAGHDTSQDA